MWSVAEFFLGWFCSPWQHQWYRKLRGGHWEHVYVRPLNQYMWLPLKDHNKQATYLIRLTGAEKLLECEDWE